MKIIISVALILLSLSLCAQNEELNQRYLAEFDRNVLLTIEMLTTFNDAVQTISMDLNGIGVYQKFLLEMTLECSSLREIVESDADSEEVIKNLISHLKPGVEVPSSIKSASVREKLVNYTKILEKRVTQLRKKIVLAEKNILESKTYTKQFLELHAKHFLYSLLLDFLQPAEYLSDENSVDLFFMVKDIEKLMMPVHEKVGEK